jgi:uncharacterized membrane protein
MRGLPWFALLSYINKSAFYPAAVLGGFGAFIDEADTFITGDNNYLFHPSIALIYIIIIFVALFLGAAVIHNRLALTEQERLVNVLDLTKEVVPKDTDVDEKNRALKLLYERSTSKSVALALKNILCAIDYIPVP